MKYYAIRILCLTDESREYEKLHDGDNEAPCPLNLLEPRPCKINIECVESYFPHSENRATVVYMKSGDQHIVTVPFDIFDDIVMNDKYQTTGENKIAK